MFLIILLSNIFLSFSISSEIDKTSLNLYSNAITSFINNAIDDDSLIKMFHENIEKLGVQRDLMNRVPGLINPRR